MNFNGMWGREVARVRNGAVGDVLLLRDRVSVLVHVVACCGIFRSEDELLHCPTLRDCFVVGRLLLDDVESPCQSLNNIMARYVENVVKHFPISMRRLDEVVHSVYFALEGAIVKSDWPHTAREQEPFEDSFFTSDSWEQDAMKAAASAEKNILANSKKYEEKIVVSFQDTIVGNVTPLTAEQGALKTECLSAQEYDEYGNRSALDTSKEVDCAKFTQEMEEASVKKARHAIASMSQKCQECKQDIHLGDPITHCDVGWCHSNCVQVSKE